MNYVTAFFTCRSPITGEFIPDLSIGPALVFSAMVWVGVSCYLNYGTANKGESGGREWILDGKLHQ